MDADKSRPVRRPPAVAAKRDTVRRPRKLARPELDAGPPQRVRDLLYDLHEEAGRPALEDLEKRIAGDDRLDGSPKKDLIHRIISRGGPATLDDIRAVARTLARACGQDEYTVAAQVTQLIRSPERPSVPRLLLSPRSSYVAQVRQIAPPALVGREAELQELARFCLDEQAGAYAWWQAGPWTGKSALLSTFVLHPPETVRSRVQVVAFFITARLAAQDTRQAFTAVVGEQLAALTGQQVPAVIDESLREAWLLDLLDQAAAACHQQGMRLVLLVDGLDEDRGVTTGPHARSIAALLPGVPPAGMRVIVAGRPNPPVPDDVPDWHPLRDRGIIRPLAGSPHARDLQRLGQSELKRLLTGSSLEQDLLGLLTAARGGLSSDDLHELTGAGLVEIEEVLHTVAGRTFTRRSPQGAAADGPLVYLLGHEELDAAARRYLGETRLSGYRHRLHDWADRYRRPSHGGPGWPQCTPEYLLLGYPRMLSTAGDVSRLVELVTDPARHDRMLDLTGGDAAALAEITTCQDLARAGPGPDLETMLRLCIRRNNLADRNSRTPRSLPAVWATLGQPARAEALARSITDPDGQAQALTEVVGVIAAAGEPDRAETVARTITDPSAQVQALAAVAGAIAASDPGRTRQLADQAETVARTITSPSAQVQALAAVVGAVAGGDRDRARQLAAEAETVARSITDPNSQVQALTEVGRAVAAGDPDLARQLAAEAETVARSITHPYPQVQALTEVARAAAAAGDSGRARQLAADAETTARTPTNPNSHPPALTEVAGWYSQTGALTEAARAVAAAGDPDRAETVARSITDPSWQPQALTAVARAVAAAGDPDRAETVARSITDPNLKMEVLTAVAAAAAAGDPDRAETVARSITDPYSQVQVLSAVAWAVAAAGNQDRARQLAADAETTARSITNPNLKMEVLAAVAPAVAAAGDPDHAETVARSITNPYWQTQALTAVAGAIAAAGDPDRAETMARSITNPKWQTQVVWQAEALIAVAGAVAAGDPDRAWQLAADAETVARSITSAYSKAWALTEVARVIAAAGSRDRAGHLLGELLAVGSWNAPLLVLAEHWPRVVLRCVNALSGNERSRDTQTLPDTDPDLRSSPAP